MVRVLDLQFGGLEFKSRPDHLLDLFSVVLSSNPPLVSSQLVCLRPVGIMLNLDYSFHAFARPHQHQCYKYCQGYTKDINTVKTPCATTSHKQSLLISDHLSQTPKFPCKSPVVGTLCKQPLW